jgi:hypothetical protein
MPNSKRFGKMPSGARGRNSSHDCELEGEEDSTQKERTKESDERRKEIIKAEKKKTGNQRKEGRTSTWNHTRGAGSSLLFPRL